MVLHRRNQLYRCLYFLYHNWLGTLIRPLLRTHGIAKLYARYQDSTLSKHQIKSFIKKHNIAMEEFVTPPNGFTSFNDFFIRTLRPGVRTVDWDDNVLVSPADSRVLIIPEVSAQERFFVKEKPFNLHTFLADRDLAQEYEGGSLMLCRLSSRDYHRYHFPCDSIPNDPTAIPGSLESVHPLAYEAGLLPLQENERHRFVLRSELFDDILVIVVGAMFVGRITHTYTVGANCSKGDEMGYFSFGGSSLVLLFKRGIIRFEKNLVDRSAQHVETSVLMGERVGIKERS